MTERRKGGRALKSDANFFIDDKCEVKDTRRKADNEKSIADILTERGSRYGDFKGHAAITQEIKRAMAKSKNWEFISDDKKECFEMIAHKIGRALNGDSEYIDNFTDIIGYTRLVEDDLKAVLNASEPQGAE